MMLKEMKRGQVFTLAGYEWITLEHDSATDSILITTKECIEDMPFDEDGSNDFRNSSLRQYLNNDFLADLVDGGLDPNDIVLTDFDLTNSEGNNLYGSCRDKIGLLDINQFKRHKEVLELDDWWWLITPSSGPVYVRRVHTSGGSNNDNAYHGHRGVRPALNLKSNILVSSGNKKLSDYTTEELLKELLKRETEQ